MQTLELLADDPVVSTLVAFGTVMLVSVVVNVVVVVTSSKQRPNQP